ncbi:MAG TPA: class I SAM-dependent methyltransferase [Acidimicrobiales bacterium]|nr:class I SAM-dependent methyltransferase [Acidimicrobiales bacterium]
MVPLPQPYLHVLDRIHQHLRPRCYVEIGVRDGRSMALMLPGTRGIGIDPQPKLRFPLCAGADVYPVTSDEFFASSELTRSLLARPVDLAFIDGMHLFEFALRDFINLERFAGPGTRILLHDCYPIDASTAARERTTDRWSGDIWKLIVCLKDQRPDLRIGVVDVAPTGLGVIGGLDPTSRVLADDYDAIVDRYRSLPYGYLEETGKADVLNRVPADWDRIRPLLPPRPFRRGAVRLMRARRTVARARPLARAAMRGRWRRARARLWDTRLPGARPQGRG